MFVKKHGECEAGAAAKSSHLFHNKRKETGTTRISCRNLSRHELIGVLAVFFAGGILLILTQIGLIDIPCLWKSLFGIPCPGCGLNRSFTLITEFHFVEAVKMNIASVLLFLGGMVTIVAALVELFLRKPILSRLRLFIRNKWFLIAAVVLAAVSWVYNIARGI
jgi:hypothetical protein